MYSFVFHVFKLVHDIVVARRVPPAVVVVELLDLFEIKPVNLAELFEQVFAVVSVPVVRVEGFPELLAVGVWVFGFFVVERHRAPGKHAPLSESVHRHVLFKEAFVQNSSS